MQDFAQSKSSGRLNRSETPENKTPDINGS
mgnify:CR=1 FL=1